MAATFPNHEFHDLALAALAETTGSNPALFCRSTEQSFLRLATSPRLIAHYGAKSMTNRTALAALQALQARSNVRTRDEPAGTSVLWQSLAKRNTASPKVWMDAYLAAFAISGSLRFISLDGDFKHYKSHGLHLVYLKDEG